MPIESKKTLLSLIPNRVPKILDIGRENRMHSDNGSLCLATVCRKLVYYLVELHTNAEVRAYLQNNKGTLLDLIDRGVHKIISEDSTEK